MISTTKAISTRHPSDHPRQRSWTIPISLAVIVVDLTLVLWWGSPGFRPHHIIGSSSDPDIYLWFLRWWGWALSHHRSLIVTRLVNRPFGNNILWDTAVPLLFVPLSLLHGMLHWPVDALYNGLWVVLWAGSALTAFATFFRLTQNLVGSALAQFMVLFSGYFNTEGMAHLDLLWLGFTFGFLAVWIQWQLERRSTASWILWTTVFSLGQWLTNEELFVMMWLTAMIGVALSPLASSPIRRRWRSLLLVMGIVAAMTLPLYLLQIQSPWQPTDAVHFSGFFGVDLENLIWTSVHTIWHAQAPRGWVGNTFEDVGYLGIPFFILFAVYLGTSRMHVSRDDWHTLRWLICWWISLVVISLGAFLRWDGQRLADLPGIVFTFMPLLRDMVLPRFMGLASWILGLIVATLFPYHRRGWAMVGVVAGFLIVLISWMPKPDPSLSTSSPDTRVIPTVLHHTVLPKPVVLVFPYDSPKHPTNLMLIQSKNHFTYRLAEGYLSPSDDIEQHFPRLSRVWSTLGRLRSPSQASFPTAQWSHPLYDYLKAAHLNVIIVLRHTSSSSQYISWWTEMIGPPQGQTAQATYWLHPLNDFLHRRARLNR